MKAQLMINGKLEDVEIDENGGITTFGYKKEKKLTGWERVEPPRVLFYTRSCDLGHVSVYSEIKCKEVADHLYEVADYFSKKNLAENIDRAQSIWRKILRWQAENDTPINLNERCNDKYYIYYDTDHSGLRIEYTNYENEIFALYFSSYEIAKKCMSEFYDDLLWLATGFRRRMDG